MLKRFTNLRLDETEADTLPPRPMFQQRSDLIVSNTFNTVKPTNLLRLFDMKALGDLTYEQTNQELAEISVVIPLYNYTIFITECLESVVKQDLKSLSLIVIDDCSTDGGGELAVKFLETHGNRFAAARVVRHRRNQGLAMTRNSGIAWTSEPFLFMLDADNRIRPPALSRLMEALLSSKAEFAYSQLYLFGSQNAVANADIWDPGRFPLVGNYIDGMALIRRQALLSVEGYRDSAVEDGWEDFDLWCSFAERGYRGVYLPELLCEYRVHDASMRARTDLYQRSLALEIALRHPTLLSRGVVPPFVENCSPDAPLD
jgi:glycosyltransferase involved in cell wall biosynthesis